MFSRMLGPGQPKARGGGSIVSALGRAQAVGMGAPPAGAALGGMIAGRKGPMLPPPPMIDARPEASAVGMAAPPAGAALGGMIPGSRGGKLGRLGAMLPPPPTIDARPTADASLPPAGSPSADGMVGQLKGLQRALQGQMKALPTPDAVDTRPWDGAPTQGVAPEWLTTAGQKSGGMVRGGGDWNAALASQPTRPTSKRGGFGLRGRMR